MVGLAPLGPPYTLHNDNRRNPRHALRRPRRPHTQPGRSELGSAGRTAAVHDLSADAAGRGRPASEGHGSRADEQGPPLRGGPPATAATEIRRRDSHRMQLRRSGRARRRGVVVANVPSYGAQSVAQMVFGHLLHHALGVGLHSQGVHEGRWSRTPDFCYWEQPLIELAGLTMGIVGFGRIGRTTAAIARRWA